MKLDSQYPFNIEMFTADNKEHYQERFEESNEGGYCNDPDAFDKRCEENTEEILSDMSEAFEEKLREIHSF